MTDYYFIRVSNQIEKARSPDTSIKELSSLAKDLNWTVRRGVATNPHTPAEVLTELAEDESIHVRHAVRFANPSCPETVKIWFRMGGFAGMTLAEFVEKVNDGLL